MKKVIFLLVICFIAFTTCRKDDNNSQPKIEEKVKIPATTKILSESDATNNLTSMSSDSTVFTFNSNLNKTQSIKINDVIVIPTGGGFLKRVTQVKNENNQIIISTIDASLSEAIQKGEGSFDMTYNTADFQSFTKNIEGISLDTVKLKSASGVQFINFTLDCILYDKDGDHLSRNDQIKISGSFGIFPKISGKFSFDNYSVDIIEVNFEISEQLKLNLDAGYAIQSGLLQEKLGTLKFPRQIVLIGVPPALFPVIIGPELDIYGGVRMDICGELKTGIIQNLSDTYSLNYNQGKWSSIVQKNQQFDFIKPVLNAGVKTKVFIKPKLKLKIYESVSPYLDTELYGEFDAMLNSNPLWKFYYGLNIGAGVNMSIFGKNLLDYSTKFLELKAELARADNSPPPLKPELLLPQKSATQISVNPALSWKSTTDATSYVLQLSIDDKFTNLISDIKDITATNRTLSGLLVGKLYFWRVKAVNNGGWSEWSETWSFTTVASVNQAPLIPSSPSPTNNATNIPTSSTLSWACSDPETDPLTYDIYFDTNPSPTAKVSADQVAKTYNPTGLVAGKDYYWKVVAKDNQGSTTEGPIWKFTTLVSNGGNNETDSFTDPRDGNTYKAVKIGNQWWMAENLVYLPVVSPPSAGSATAPYYYVYGYSGTNVTTAKATTNYQTYGVLYNWEAAKAACPPGWHLPSDAEWKELEMTLGMTQTHANSTGYRGTEQELLIKSITGWSNNRNGNNLSGFNAIPTGDRSDNGSFNNSIHTTFWTSTETSSSEAWWRDLHSNYSGIARNYYGKSLGYSVRCIKDSETTGSIPTNGLVAYYPFNGNANDESGNGNNGTNNGATITNDRFGNADKAYSFDNTDITIPITNSLDFSKSFTISVWTKKIGSDPRRGSLIATGGSNCARGFLIQNRDGGIRLECSDGSGWCVVMAKTNINTEDNKWHHFMFVVDGILKKANGYVDGVKVIVNHDISAEANMSNSSRPIRIGSLNSSGDPQYFNGIIDDIRIYNRVLTDLEIQSLFKE